MEKNLYLRIIMENLNFNYRLKACKKNGKPKEDYPPYYGDSVLGDTGTKTFSLIYIDKQLITKPIINRKTGPACPECSIF